MKNILYFTVLAIWACTQSCDTMIDPPDNDFNKIKPIFLLPSTPNTTLYNNQKIAFLRISTENISSSIDSIRVFHNNTLLLVNTGHSEWSNFIDIRLNVKFEPGKHILKVQLVNRYRAASEYAETTITVLQENMPEPEIIISGLEDGKIASKKAITLTFNTNPILFYGNVMNYETNYYFENKGYYSYNNIIPEEYNDYYNIQEQAHIHFIKQNEADVYNLPENFYNNLKDELVDINGVNKGDQVSYAFSDWMAWFEEGEKYTMYMIANNGWLENYYLIENLEYTNTLK